MENNPGILIIDDQEDLLDNLRLIFESEGYTVDTAVTARSALETCRGRLYDLAIVDIKLPDAAGDALVEDLRKTDPELSCILITGNATLESAMNAVGRGGIVAYETKPLNMDRLLALAGEVTARKRAERALRESDERYRRLVESSPYGVLVAQDGRVVFINRRAGEILGRTIDDIADMTALLALVDPADRERAASVLTRPDGGGDATFRITRGDGREASLRAAASDIVFGGRPALMTYIEDVTEITRMQLQILRSEKYAAIAQLSMGLHHEIKNPLAIISGHAETLMDNTGLRAMNDPDVDRSLDVMYRQTKRIATILNNLSALARETIIDRRPVNLRRLAETLRDMFQPRLEKTGIALAIDAAQDVELRSGDENGLLQAFTNIMFNAVEAMPNGGELSITVRVTLPGPISVEFEDTGCGVPPDDIERIFDPFYTTKQDGMGLGLATCRKVIEAHGGRITVSPRRPFGARVAVEFPPAGENAE